MGRGQCDPHPSPGVQGGLCSRPRTAKSRSALLLFPLGFLCVSEPRYTELRSKESSGPVMKEEVRLGVGLCDHLGHQEGHLVIIALPLPPVSAFMGLLYESLT